MSTVDQTIEILEELTQAEKDIIDWVGFSKGWNVIENAKKRLRDNQVKLRSSYPIEGSTMADWNELLDNISIYKK